MVKKEEEEEEVMVVVATGVYVRVKHTLSAAEYGW